MKRFDVKKIITILSVAVILFGFQQTTFAQQITSSSVPNTRNPQTTQADLINQKGSIQEPSNASLLTTSESISIPSGQPVAAVKSDEKKKINWLQIVIVTSAIIAISAALVIFLKQYMSSTEDTKNAVTEKPEPKLTREITKPKPTTKTVKKKKRRSKSKKLRKK